MKRMAERRRSLPDGLRLRVALFIPLLLLCFGGTLLSVIILRTIVQQQVRENLASDLEHSISTYSNFARQAQELQAREAALVADLPSLKALMTADARTIVDGGAEFWQTSGSDFFALLDRNGKLIAFYNRGAPLNRVQVSRGLETDLQQQDVPELMAFDRRLYAISLAPLWFGDRAHESDLGYVALGSPVDEHVAREVREAAAAEVAFTVDGRIVASTLTPELQSQLSGEAGGMLSTPTHALDLTLGKVHYLAASVPLGALGGGGGSRAQLVVLKSFDQASHLVSRINRWILALALAAFVAGFVLLVSISRTITGPIGTLVEGTRALASGNFDYQLRDDGVEEIRELSRAFERMRITLQRTQGELLESERLATIGRMASSISHDLRHYLSAMYANAEFMSNERVPQAEREELFLEIQTAVQGMTDLLDSLLLFTRTGRALHLARESIAAVAQRAVSLVRSHPAARDVRILTIGSAPYEGWVDAQKLVRAVYNLLLNACQAARRGTEVPAVTLELEEDSQAVRLRIIDNGSGVPEDVQQTMFLPFVSAGKESGLGLGLTLAQQIAQEHGGSISLEEARAGRTVFTLTLSRLALQALARNGNKDGAIGLAELSEWPAPEKISTEAKV